MDYIGLALKLWPLFERLRDLHIQAQINGEELTEAEARAELEKAITDLDRKIQDDLDSHSPQ